MHVGYARMTALKMRQQRRLAWDRAKQQVLHFGRYDGVIYRILPVSNRRYLDHFTRFLCAVVLREFTERTFGLTHIRENAALDHDLRKRWHAHVVRDAFDDRQWRAMQCAGNLQ